MESEKRKEDTTLSGIPIWFYPKKRGSRWTGSRRAASIGELLFFGTILVLGIFGTMALWVELLCPEWEVNFRFVEGACRVTDRRVESRLADGGEFYRPLVTLEYMVDDQLYRTTTYDIRGNWYEEYSEASQRISTVQVGGEYQCWFDPQNPRRAVLVRGYTLWVWMTLMIPFSLIAMSAGRLLYLLYAWKISTERRADVLRWRLSKQLRPDAVPGPVPRIPYCGVVPAEPDHSGEMRSPTGWSPATGTLTNSRGTVLGYRLPTTREFFWSVGMLLTASILWNLIAAGTLVAVVSHSVIVAKVEWGALICSTLLLLAGVGLVIYTWRQYDRWLGHGTTIAEISEIPLRPGECGELYIAQNGRIELVTLEIFLICEEQATFGHGTNTRRETVRVWQERLALTESRSVSPENPVTIRCPISIPVGAMHSFQSAHNRISWMLLVRITSTALVEGGASQRAVHDGTDAGGRTSDALPSLVPPRISERRFPLLVAPATPDMPTPAP